MTTYIEINDGTVTANKPGTESLFRQLRDNPLAIAEGDSGAPRINPAALGLPYFSASRTTDYSSATNLAFKMQFNTEVYDPYGLYDNATNYRFTPNKAGVYLVGLRVFLNTLAAPISISPGVTYGSYPTGGLVASIYKNGSSFQSMRGSPTGSSIAQNAPIDGRYLSAECITLVQMNGTTDYIEGYIQDSISGSFGSGNGYQGVFLGYRPGSALMQKFFDTIQDKYGNALQGASIIFRDHGTSDVSTIYEDDESTEKMNPVISDVNGFVEAMLPNGKYDITITYRGLSRTIVGYAARDPNTGNGQEVTSVEASVVSCSTQMPFDDSIPQNTEGNQVVTVTIAPEEASSDIEIEYLAAGSVTAAMFVGAAVFKDSDTDALAGSVSMEQTTGANQKFQLSWTFRVSAGSTSARTYKLRVGPNNSGTAHVNGDSSGARLFGGNLKAIITAREIIV